MSDKKAFFKSGILLSAVGLAMRGASMIFASFISRAVGAEATGLYTLVMTVYSLALTFATSGISLTVTRLVASVIGESCPGRVGKIMKSATVYALCFSVSTTILLFFGANIIGEAILSDQRTVTALKILSLSLVPASLSAVISGYFVGVKRVKFNATASMFCQTVRIGLTALLVTYAAPYGTSLAVSAISVAMTLTELLGFILFLIEYIIDRKRTVQKSTQSFNSMKQIREVALPLAFSAYVRAVLLNIEHILIPKRLRDGGESSSEAYSHYGSLHGMALPLVTLPMSPLSSFAGLLVPEFAEDMAAGREKRMSRIASKAINLTLAYASATAVLLFSFAEDLGYAVYGSYESAKYISILAFVVPIMYLDHVTDGMLKGIGEQVFSMWVNITDSLLSVILVWILIPKMGITGYALVIIIMEGYNFVLSFFRLRGRVKFAISPISFFAPIIFTSFAVFITNRLFAFGGSGVNAFWLTMKISFASCLSIAAFAAFSLINEYKWAVFVRKDSV